MSKKILVYIDAINIGSTGGLNHLVNILNGAPDNFNNKKIIYEVWGKPNLLKKLPSTSSPQTSIKMSPPSDISR